MIAVHKVSDFKPRAGKIFDAAKKSPQYVIRDGVLLVIQRTEAITGVERKPAGFFADAYDDADRAAREERLFAATPFKPER